MLELVLHQYERIGSHVGVKQRAVPVVPFAAVEHQPIAHRSKRLAGPWEKLCEQDLRANVPLFSVGALTPLNHLGPGELIVEEIGPDPPQAFADQMTVDLQPKQLRESPEFSASITIRSNIE